MTEQSLAPLTESQLNGILLINKPEGPTSYDLIRWMKRVVRGVKIGHSGTLDPMASGLMIILLGKATKSQSSFMSLEKTYHGWMKLGISTDTGDITGQVTQNAAVPSLSPALIEPAFEAFRGDSLQTPPMYSALKKEGVPLYKLARKGKTVEREPRSITIHELTYLSHHEDEVEFRVRCSSGTYIRTLVEDLGKKLGTCATMSRLVREKIGDFSLEQALSEDALKSASLDDLAARLLPAGLS